MAETLNVAEILKIGKFAISKERKIINRPNPDESRTTFVVGNIPGFPPILQSQIGGGLEDLEEKNFNFGGDFFKAFQFTINKAHVH
jgi:hypothetical protein